MARGIIYTMTTVVPGLIKIGKTGTANFEQRMYNLESNGYKNVVGLKRHFAIEVDDYDEKETLLDTIFSKSQVPGTELFALDINLVVQLLSSFDGKQIYPKTETKEASFDNATANIERSIIPDGIYTMSRKIKKADTVVEAKMQVKDGKIILKAGAVMSPIENGKSFESAKKARTDGSVKNNVLQHDIECSSVSEAAGIVVNGAINGWTYWKNKDGDMIDVYRKKKTQ